MEEEEQSNPNMNKALKMVCASTYYPKRKDLKPLGEDAHFICADEQVIGVADGVGSWASRGVDAGEYARELMFHTAIAVLRHSANSQSQSSPTDHIDPKRVLSEAFPATRLPGSSTACVLAHSGGVLRAANVGDSGFMLFRDGKLFYRSRTQQKGFNCPYQLGNSEKSDRPECADETRHDVAAGDVIVLGTDGLLDNLFVHEIEQILEGELKRSTAKREEGDIVDPIGEVQEIADFIANIALCYSLDRERVSPFSEAAERAGKRRVGGKVDDITVIVGQIVTISSS